MNCNKISKIDRITIWVPSYPVSIYFDLQPAACQSSKWWGELNISYHSLTLGYKFGAFVLELNAKGNLTVMGIMVSGIYFFILLATVSGDFSFVNAYCVLTVIGFHCNSFDTWCDEIISCVKWLLYFYRNDIYS